MKISFLSADKPIIKSYELTPTGELVKHSYPFVYEVSSQEHQVSDLVQLTALMKQHAALGHCMLKGELSRQLVTESRAGSTDSDAHTDWICLDLDGIENYQTVDLFLADIGAADVDHIVQWSSSMGVENKAGFRCHIIMRLSKPQSPHILKSWLMGLNLNTSNLAAQLELTKTGNSLRWPLDITTCQNDKLLYIAPPALGPGIPDPFPSNNRITFEKRKAATLALPYPTPNPEQLRVLVDSNVDRLRTAANLPKRKTSKYKFNGTVEYMTNPGTAQISEMKTERGFVYFNLNGGDSWAYYHPEDNPKFVFNFKGEPAYRTEDLLPQYWAQVQSAAKSNKPNSKGQIFLAFRDFQTSNYFNGWYDTATDKLTLAQAKSESQLRQFMAQNGQTLGENIPDWTLTWEPLNPTIVDTQNQTLNTFQPSSYYLDPNPPTPPAQIPPTILKVIEHVLGHDPATIDHFINWLAVIIQHQTRTGTAWVWQGTQGTGKGVLFHQIITPLLSEHNVVSKRMEELESEFTGFMENKFVVFIDEIEAGKSLYHTKVTAKLKNLIVEPTISIRRMYTPAYMAPNFASMIFASNKPAAVEISPDDRRFNVGPYQNVPIQLTSTDVDVHIPAELPYFFAYLKSYKADPSRARKPLHSAARATLIDISRTALDTVSDALLEGNLEFFWDHLNTDSKLSVNPLQQLRYQPFRDLVCDFVANHTTNTPTKITREELRVMMEWCVGGMPEQPHKFTALLKHHKLHLQQIWKNGRNVKGVTLEWKPDPVWLTQAQSEIVNGIV